MQLIKIGSRLCECVYLYTLAGVWLPACRFGTRVHACLVLAVPPWLLLAPVQPRRLGARPRGGGKRGGRRIRTRSTWRRYAGEREKRRTVGSPEVTGWGIGEGNA